ncbi:hypothetical protein GCM10011519_31050 [Marmoricola endophyticus]|uniref:Xaa-Pro dipeptidyl-peptidase C-terminal domain-containing protein n=1 Tax=Marmoricola endophyticus TaxID=2040280 RepID=A0A917BT19_9ACTN|nr:hypothetical protein GCM10011519_31050 [Marmoricola endophyticus]
MRPLLAGTSAAALLAGVLIAAPATGSPTASPAAPDPAGGVTHDENPGVPVGAAWSNAYFPAAQADSPTAVTLHADVLRPEGLKASDKTPVIVSVGPYFNHSGQTDRETDTYQPSSRFDDLIDGAKLMQRGYTVVLVDNRGFGGSTGCLDWLGSGEQADITAAVQWAATQRWSTGKVGMYGKSYDAVTGLWGADLKPKGLDAVVAQEPLWDMYPYLYSNDVPRPNQTGTPLAYNSIASLGGTTGDSARYQKAAAYEKQHPECLARNLHDNVVNTSHDSTYWTLRDQAAKAKGATTPLFVTQGFTESNTKPEEMQEYLRNHAGSVHAWFGPWEHVRGNEVDTQTGQLSQGRAGFFDEVVRFYDQHLKGIAPSVQDPAFAVQDNFGHWRAQKTWPQVDRRTSVALQPGQYLDAGPVSSATAAKALTSDQRAAVQQRGVPARTVRRPAGGDLDQLVRSSLGTQAERSTRDLAAAASTPTSYQTWSKAVPADVRVTGTPRIALRTRGTGEVYVSLWDVDPAAGKATVINENVAQLSGSGRTFDLKGMDWTLSKGHRLVVTIGTIETGGWNALPSGRLVQVKDATLNLTTQSTAGDVPTQGSASPWLQRYIADNTIEAGTPQPATFTVPQP